MKKIIRKIKIIIRELITIIVNRIFVLIFPLKQNRVLFLSDNRETLGGNLKFVYDYLPEEKYEEVLSLKADKRLRRSLKEKINLMKYLATSRYILLEDLVHSTAHMKVRKGQELIQLWHGPGAFKKFGHSRESTDLKRIHKGYKKYAKAIVSAEAIRPCYAEAFSISIDKVKATGFPRTDEFFDTSLQEEKKKQLYQKYPFLKGKKVILFAPTYRGKNIKDAHYDLEQLDLEKIYQSLHENYIFLFKWHPLLYMNNQLKNIQDYNIKIHPDFYYDLSVERDINDLLLISDILITDYSSVIFDYALLNKPVIYFTYDYDEYVNQGRGLYFPFEEYVYGTVVTNDDDLIQAIQEEKMELEKRKVFIEKFMSACDGNSTKKTCEWIFGKDVLKE